MATEKKFDLSADRYPRPVVLRDGRRVLLRPMTRDDEERLLEFFKGIPLSDRRHLAEDVTDPKVIKGWMRRLDYDRVLPLLAEYEGRIVADAALRRPDTNYQRHLGNIRIVVAPDFRRQNLGRQMIRELVYQAMRRGLDKVDMEVPGKLVDRLGPMLASMGFGEAATLRWHIKDLDGNLDDLVIYSNDVEQIWEGLSDLYQDFMVFREF